MAFKRKKVKNMELSPRQVHLDFHTSEYISSVAEDFDPEQFAATVREAAVSSMTVFARCHHGWLYYPSKKFPERIHPNLKRPDLMVQQVRALHRAGVRAPVYITVQWDHQAAKEHPEWLIRKPGGAHEGPSFLEPGFYQSLCVNTGYREYLRAVTEEVCALLGNELDGVFFDIVGIRPCWCARCRADMAKAGVDMRDERAVAAFARDTLDAFKAQMTALVHSFKADATVFYNAGHVGPCTRPSAESYSHFELESLPSGGWGYLHFPLTARYARGLGKPALGMTGKFHTSWGDFHSLKNREALEFEAFRMLSLGFCCSIGDQLEPCGRLNEATYRLIGSVYRPFAERERWALPSRPVCEAALLTSEDPLKEQDLSDSILGAAQLLEELSVQYNVLDAQMPLDGYRLVILPEDFTITPDFSAKLQRFVENGGAVIACAGGALDKDGGCDRLFGAQYLGEEETEPTFVVPTGALAAGLEEDTRYAMYGRGLRFSPLSGTETLLYADAPYFKKQGERFCSHRYVPAGKQRSGPALLRRGRAMLFCHPLMKIYRESAPRWVKLLFYNAMALLLPGRLVEHNGPSTLTVSLLEQPQHKRYALHLLSYIPVRKSATIDVIEDRTPAYEVSVRLQLPKRILSARLVPEDIPLQLSEEGTLFIPKVDGYAIVELPYEE